MCGGEVRIEIEDAPKLFLCVVSAPRRICDITKSEMRPRVAVVEFHGSLGVSGGFIHLGFIEVPTELPRHEQYKRQHAMSRIL
jgi:hypothetical protein